jgi:Flp pilus assembly protein TadB
VTVSKQKAQRRAQQQAVQRQEAKAARDAKQARSRQRRAERAKGGRSRSRGRVGFAGMRRSRRQRIGITVVAGGAIAVLWLFTVFGAVDVGLAIALTVLLLVALPAFVVLALGRRY